MILVFHIFHTVSSNTFYPIIIIIIIIKWYMHNPALVLENATYKLLWDFNIQTDHLIPARRPDLIIINKKKKRINFYLLRIFCTHLGSFCVVSSFSTFRPNFTSGLLQVILPRPRIGMLSLVTVSPPYPVKSPEGEPPEENFGRNVVKKETTQKLQR